MTLAADLVAALVAADQTVSTAESLTGGLLCGALTSVPGASAVVRGGLVAYATQVKAEVLGVPAELLAENGAVSEPVARAMAQGARDLFGSTWALSTTGVAGPDRQEGKPVGTVFVALAGPRSVVHSLHLTGDREQVRGQTCEAALELLWNTV